MAAENIGWRLENVVFVELQRRCAKDFTDIYFYKPEAAGKEVDFVLCDRNKAIELVQVAYNIDSEKTLKRETSALVAASDTLHCESLTLIALTQTRDIEMDGKTIHIKSVLDWLLSLSE